MILGSSSSKVAKSDVSYFAWAERRHWRTFLITRLPPGCSQVQAQQRRPSWTHRRPDLSLLGSYGTPVCHFNGFDCILVIFFEALSRSGSGSHEYGSILRLQLWWVQPDEGPAQFVTVDWYPVNNEWKFSVHEITIFSLIANFKRGMYCFRRRYL